MPAKSIAGRASARPSRCTSSGISRKASASVSEVQRLAVRYGVQPGLDQSECLPGPGLQVRFPRQPRPEGAEGSLNHVLDSVEIADASGQPRSLAMVCRRLQLSGHSEHPRSAKSGSRKASRRLTRSSPAISACWWNTNPLSPRSITPTSPIGAWRCCSRKSAGPHAKVLVDTGHHYQAQNIEQIVAWLLDVDMLGGFHFNDRRYADDDLTMGSIDPYQVFRIFHEIRCSNLRLANAPISPT